MRLFHALDWSGAFWRRLLAGVFLAAHSCERIFGGALLARNSCWRILSGVCSAPIVSHVHIASEGAVAIIYE